ncbi:Rho GTPase activation protein [Baffinella frigidus]|nr:Rho GTPase activation protein [Cryptophyta sp. CCMP2293]
MADEKALRVVRKCALWLQKENKNRLSEEGLFRIPGSTSKIKALVATLGKEKDGAVGTLAGDEIHHIHDVAGTMKRVLLDLEPPLLQPKVFDGLLKAQFGAAGLQQKISTIRRLLSSLQETRLEILRTVLLFLRVVVEAQEQRQGNKMGTSNICKLFAASLLRHPDDMKTAVNLASNRLPTVIATLLLSDAILDTTFHPSECRACRDAELEKVLEQTYQGLNSGSTFSYGVPIEQAQKEAATRSAGHCAAKEHGSADRPAKRPISSGVAGWFSSAPKTRRAPLSYFEDGWEDAAAAGAGEVAAAVVADPAVEAEKEGEQGQNNRWSFDPFSWRLPRVRILAPGPGTRNSEP